MYKIFRINHYIFGDKMVYFFINVLMYLVLIFFLVKYLKYQMNTISFIVMLFNVNIFSIMIYQNINFIYGIMVCIISLISLYFFNMFTKDNKEIILIKNGNINFHELLNNYSYYRLVNYLRLHRIHLDEVAYCIKKNNNLLVIKNRDISYPISIIIDGKLIDENLKLINKDEEWLKRELLEKNLLIKNIDYAYYKKNKIYFVNN